MPKKGMPGRAVKANASQRGWNSPIYGQTYATRTTIERVPRPQPPALSWWTATDPAVWQREHEARQAHWRKTIPKRELTFDSW